MLLVDLNPAGIEYRTESLNPDAKFVSNRAYAKNFERFLR